MLPYSLKNGRLYIHLTIWLLFCGFMYFPFLSDSRPLPHFFFPRFLLIVFLFYINYFYLVPRFLLNKGLFQYVVLSLLIIGSFTWLEFGFLPDMPFPELGRPVPRSRIGTRLPVFPIVFRLGIVHVISSILRIYFEWKKNEVLRKEIEKENIKSELQLLKTQLDPHFLFNSLNTIYALAVKKSLETPDAVVNLSELMRYMIYEADKDMVPLTKELDYIKSYVQLQLLRHSDNENVSLKISGVEKGKVIPPLIFISFIENAFKYGTDYNGRIHIKIEFLIQEESLDFSIRNRIVIVRKSTKSSGIGLENVQNRLRLLFPGTHTLKISNDGENYRVDLKLMYLKNSG